MNDPDIPILINAARARARVLLVSLTPAEYAGSDGALLLALAERLERLAAAT
jgi:hypothetical protein